MQKSEIFILIFFLIYLIFPLRKWTVKKNEFLSVILFALFFPFVLEPIWVYTRSEWTVFIFNVPLFFILYWVVVISFSVNLSDYFLNKFSKKMRFISILWLNLLTDIVFFGFIGTLCETVLHSLNAYNYTMGTDLGFIPLINVPVILLLGYVGLGIFGAHTFRKKKEEGVI